MDHKSLGFCLGYRHGALLLALSACSGSTENPGSLAADLSAAAPLIGAGSGLCLDVTHNSTAAGTPLQIYTCNRGANQAFAFTPSAELRVFNNTQCVQPLTGAGTPGMAAVISPCDGQAHQRWTFNANGSISSQSSGLCLDVFQQKTALKTPVNVWTCNGQSNQSWSFPTAQTPVSVVTNRYDNARSGSNPNERILDTTNVTAAKFGMLFSQSITGQVYGQPLYVPGVTVNGATHNVMYVATAHNMVFAFDADTKQAPLWTRQLEASMPTAAIAGCGDMVDSEVGITSTPVISSAESKIYVVAKTKGATMLHALDLGTGADGAGSPRSVGTGTAGFESDIHLNRPGLLLLNGNVYIAFGSHCDSGAYHGWIFGHDAHTLVQTSSFNTTPTGSKGAIWQSGMGLASDGTSIWFAAGNGTTGGANLSMSVASITPAGQSFTLGPHHAMPANGDNDLASGPVLVGDQVLAGGKSGYLLLFNQSDASLANNIAIGGETHNMATWDGGPAGRFVYTWGDGTPLHAFALAGGVLTDKGTNSEQKPGHPGGMITVSSNGTMAGTGIVWALLPLCGDAWKATCMGGLYAWDAADITKKSLWNSAINPGDAPGEYAKYSPPTVANGKVYVATWSGTLAAYGIKPP
jgi:hypothetical protein